MKHRDKPISGLAEAAKVAVDAIVEAVPDDGVRTMVELHQIRGRTGPQAKPAEASVPGPSNPAG